MGKAVEDAGEAVKEPAKDAVETVKAAVPEAVEKFQEDQGDQLDLWEQKASGLKVVADFMKDDQLNQIVESYSEKVSEARARFDELGSAAPDTAGGLMDEISDLMTEIRELDKQYVARLNEIQG